jgi:hypothetical protein
VGSPKFKPHMNKRGKGKGEGEERGRERKEKRELGKI